MSARAKTLRTLLDAGVPDSVGDVLRTAGHEVILHREVLPDKTHDDVVCATALQNEAILIAQDGDMKAMTKRYGAPSSPRFEKLNLIRLCCEGPLASARLEQSLDLVTLEWAFTLAKPSRRLWIDICPHFIRTNR